MKRQMHRSRTKQMPPLIQLSSLAVMPRSRAPAASCLFSTYSSSDYTKRTSMCSFPGFSGHYSEKTTPMASQKWLNWLSSHNRCLLPPDFLLWLCYETTQARLLLLTFSTVLAFKPSWQKLIELWTFNVFPELRTLPQSFSETAWSIATTFHAWNPFLFSCPFYRSDEALHQKATCGGEVCLVCTSRPQSITEGFPLACPQV